jgi:CBS domain-containing protein
MRVGEIMTTSPTCCLPSDSSSRAARIMKDMDTGFVPVIEDEKTRKVIGVVTDRDLCLEVVAEPKDPESVQVRDCMAGTVVSCTVDEDVEKALDLMRDNQVRRIPVVNREGTIQGILSLADVMNRLEVPPVKTKEVLKKISEPSDDASKPRAHVKKSA